MALGNRNHYRLNQIQLRHFYQTGQKAGLRGQNMDSIFSDLITRMDDAIAETSIMAADTGVPASAAESILAGVSKRAEIMRKG